MHGNTEHPDKANPVENAIQKAAKVVVIGYSPTGGGHTARTFSIIDSAIQNNHLNKGDTVVLHCPPIWEGTNRRDIDNFTDRLYKSGLNVVLTLADKTVYGYLDPDTGASKDSEIIRRFAEYPQSKANIRDVKEAGVLWTPGNLLPINSVYNTDAEQHMINANSLIQSIVKIKGNENIYILTDMDPYLQKAASKAKLNPKNCLDQQNHGILLQSELPPDSSKAYLAKVLLSHGKISHISLGGRNSLQVIGKLASSLEIKESTRFVDARRKAIEIFIKEGTRAELDNEMSAEMASNGRVMFSKDLEPTQVDDIIYIYAHKNTPSIGEHIRKQIQQKNPNYVNKLFVFCGKDAAPGYNAMHLAYLAGAHGITTAGAGTTGEYAYLHDKANDTSRLLMLPISGHAEQQANATKIVSRFGDLAKSIQDLTNLSKSIDDLVSGKGYKLSVKEETMASFLRAVNHKETYAEQASEILFNPESSLSEEAADILKDERMLAADPKYKIERRYAKVLFQVLQYLNSPEPGENVPIHFKRGTDPIYFTIEQLCNLFEDDKMKTFLNPGHMKLEEWLKIAPSRLEDLCKPTAQADPTSGASKSMATSSSLVALDNVRSLLQKYKEHIGTAANPTEKEEIKEIEEKAAKKHITGF